MKVKCELTLDSETNEYELRFWNLSSPGTGIEYNKISPILKQIFAKTDEEIISGIDSDEQITKEIH